ncbi:MAG: serine hydrolase, partial [Acidaminobacteraceae bacterium]
MNVFNNRKKKIISRLLLLIICMVILESSVYALEVESLDNFPEETEEIIIISDSVTTENTLDVLDEEVARVIMEDEILKQKILDYLEGKKGEFSFYIIDPITGQETMINNRTISSASIIKVFLIVEVHKQIRDGKISFSDKLTLKENLKVYGSGILRKKNAGTKYSVEYLLNLVITISDNVAANMLADYVGLKNINATAKELGMDDTTFGHLILEKEKMKYYYGSNT